MRPFGQELAERTAITGPDAGEDSAGELYLLAGTNLGPFGEDGMALKIVPEPTGIAITLVFGWIGGIMRRRKHPS